MQKTCSCSYRYSSATWYSSWVVNSGTPEEQQVLIKASPSLQTSPFHMKPPFNLMWKHIILIHVSWFCVQPSSCLYFLITCAFMTMSEYFVLLIFLFKFFMQNILVMWIPLPSSFQNFHSSLCIQLHGFSCFFLKRK